MHSMKPSSSLPYAWAPTICTGHRQGCNVVRQMSNAKNWQGTAAQQRAVCTDCTHAARLSGRRSYTLPAMLVTPCRTVKLGLGKICADGLWPGCGMQNLTVCTGPEQADFSKGKHVQAKLRSADPHVGPPAQGSTAWPWTGLRAQHGQAIREVGHHCGPCARPPSMGPKATAHRKLSCPKMCGSFQKHS